MKIFESDLSEAIYEVIAGTNFKIEGEEYLNEIRVDEADYELDKDNAKITITSENEVTEIRITKTHRNIPHEKLD